MFSTVYIFKGEADGASPSALTLDQAGNIYGTAIGGGNFTTECVAGCGVIFRVDHDAPESPIYSFTSIANGVDPGSNLVFSPLGDIFGVVPFGGKLTHCYSGSGCGLVYRLGPDGSESAVFKFSGSDGEEPYSGLVRDAEGNLYGTTAYGGSFGYGTVFKIDVDGNETVLHSFSGPPTDGMYPSSTLAVDSTGNLFGATLSGGSAVGTCPNYEQPGCGVIFKIDLDGEETVLHDFSGGTDGGNPGKLIAGLDGYLYGVTNFGGVAHSGVIYKMDQTGAETVLYSFLGNGDENPNDILIRERTGDIFGTTSLGGQGVGTLFRLEPTGVETVLHSFSGRTDGSYPGGIVAREDPDGTFSIFGAASGGGETRTSICVFIYGCGTIFRFTVK